MTWPGRGPPRGPLADEENQLDDVPPPPPPAPAARPESPKPPAYPSAVHPSRSDRYGRGPDRDWWWTAKIVARSGSVAAAVVVVAVELHVLLDVPPALRDPGTATALWSVVRPRPPRPGPESRC